MFVRTMFVAFAFLVCGGALLLRAEPASAAGVVNAPCDDAGLTAALIANGGGGLVTFNCGGPAAFIITEKSIGSTTTIDGSNNGSPVTLSGGNNNRLFTVNAGTLTLQNIVLTNGAGPIQGGGAIYNFGGTLVLSNSTIQNSTVGSVLAPSSGGAIRSNGPLTITNSMLAGNSANNGGALFLFGSNATTSITNSVLHDNHATGTGAAGNEGWGGAVLMFGAMNVTIQGSDLYNNTGVTGGAIHMRFAGSSLNVQGGTQVRNNQAMGAPFNAPSGGGIHVLAGMATVSDTTLSGNSAPSGGGIYNAGLATLTTTTVSGNGATNGGGVSNDGTMTITNSTLSGNGAINNGGNVYQNGSAGSTTTLKNTIVANSTSGSIRTIAAITSVILSPQTKDPCACDAVRIPRCLGMTMALIVRTDPLGVAIVMKTHPAP